MKSKSILLFLLFFTALNGLFAFGNKQKEEEKKPVAGEWTLCITAFDVSAISPAGQTAGDTRVWISGSGEKKKATITGITPGQKTVLRLWMRW